MTSLLSVFQLGSDQQWHFAENKKKGTLEPFKDFPAFFGAWTCRLLQTKGDPGSLILWSSFPGRTWVYGVQRFRRFPPLVLTVEYLLVSGRSWPSLAPVESVRSFSLQYVRCIFIYIYNTVLLLHFVIEGYTKEKLHTMQTDFKPPTPSLS